MPSYKPINKIAALGVSRRPPAYDDEVFLENLRERKKWKELEALEKSRARNASPRKRGSTEIKGPSVREKWAGRQNSERLADTSNLSIRPKRTRCAKHSPAPLPSSVNPAFIVRGRHINYSQAMKRNPKAEVVSFRAEFNKSREAYRLYLEEEFLRIMSTRFAVAYEVQGNAVIIRCVPK